MTHDSTEPYSPAARRELLRRLNREDANLAHVIARIRDCEETGTLTAGQADHAVDAARAGHQRWCQLIREAWERQQERWQAGNPAGGRR